MIPAVAAALEAGRAEGIAPALAAAVRRGGALVHQSWHGTVPGPAGGTRPAGPDTLFDVASLTKVMATTTLVAQALAEGVLALDAPVVRWLPGFAAAGKPTVTLRHLLAHSSGLPAWRPYHERVAADPVGGVLFGPPAARADPAALAVAFARGRALVAAASLAEPLEAPPGSRVVYSDPGFIALGLVLEAALGARLPALFAARVAGPLGLTATGFVDGLEPGPTAAWAAGRAFAPARFSVPRGEVARGAVDDDVAWAMGGAAGHAGLFSTAAEVAALGQAWLDALDGRPSIVPTATARLLARPDPTPGSSRALGWDRRSPGASTLGERLGLGPRGALGHLGFTGCSLWLDLDEGLVAVLLTNHVHPGGLDAPRLNGLRRRFHDAVASTLGLHPLRE